MADKKLNIRVQTKGAKKASKDLKGVDSRLSSLGKSALKAGAAFFAARGIINAFKAVVDAAAEQELAEKKLGAVLKSTSHAAGLQAGELKKLASSLQKTTMYGDEAIIGAQSLMLTFTKIGKDVFPDAIETVLNMSTAMGTDLQSSVIQLGKALNAPVEGISALSRVGVQLTEDQKNQIKSFVEVNDVASAQKVILGELETQFGGMAEAAGDTSAGAMAQMKNALGDTAEVIGALLAPAVTKLSGFLKSAAESASNFFKRTTETSLETTIRELQSLGVNTLSFELALAKAEAAKIKYKAVGLREEKEISKSLENSANARVDLMINLAEEQAGLLESGKSEDSLRREILDKQSLLNLRTSETGAAVKREAREAIRVNEAKLAEIDLLKQLIEEQKNIINQDQADLEIVKKAEASKEHILSLEKAIELSKENQVDIAEEIVDGADGQTDAIKKQTEALYGWAAAQDVAGMAAGGAFGDIDFTTFDEYVDKLYVQNANLEHQKDLQQQLIEQYPELAKAAGLLLNEKEKLVIQDLKSAALQQGSAKDAMKAVVRAETMEAVAGYIASILKTVPFPLNLVLAAGGGAVVSGLMDKALSTFHSGGLVGGQGDTPIMAQSGEFVLSRSAVQDIGVDTAQRINQGGGAGITVNINAPLVDETVRDSIIPAIQKAQRLNLA